MSRLCIYFCNTLPRDFAPRYSPPLRTISTRVISFQHRIGYTRCTPGCIVQASRLFVSPAARPLLSFKLSPPRLENAKFVLNTKRFYCVVSQTFHLFCFPAKGIVAVATSSPSYVMFVLCLIFLNVGDDRIDVVARE